MSLNELKQARAKLITDARLLSGKADGEKRDLTSEEQNQWDAMLADADQLRVNAERLERQESHERELATVTDKAERMIPKKLDDETPEQRTARTNTETRSAWGRYFTTGETRNLEAGADVAGGFLSVPQVVVNEIIRAVDDENFMRGLARVIPPIDAESLGAPVLTKPSDADWTSELLTGSADSTMAFTKRELRPHPLAKSIRVSRKLLRQSRIDPVAMVASEFGVVFGNTEEKAFLTGTLSNQPLGVFTASTDGISTGRDVATDNTTSEIKADNLIRVKYTLKPQYWAGASWIFHTDAVSQIARLKDGEGRYLLNVDTNQLIGFPIKVSENAPSTFTTGLYVGILGNFQKGYWIVDSMNFELQRLDELYAATNQVGFIGRRETDGAPVLEEAFVRVTLG